MIDDRQLAQIFLHKELLDEAALQRGQQLAKSDGLSLYHALIQNSLVEEEKAIVAVSKQLNLPCVSLKEFEPNAKILDLVTGDLARAHQLMPLGLTDDEGERKLYVAMSNPLDIDAIDKVSQKSGFPVVPLLAGPIDVLKALKRAYSGEPLVEVEIDGDKALTDGLGDILDDIFTDGSFAEIMEESTEDDSAASDSNATPASAVSAQAASSEKAAQPLGGGLGIDFSDLDLSVSSSSGGAPSGGQDLHNRQTLPASTKLPKFSLKPNKSAKAQPAAPTPEPPEEEPKAEEPKPTHGGAAAFAESFAADWSDFADDEPETSNPRHPPPQSADNANIRYKVDPNLKKRSQQGYLANVQISDLVRATVYLLVQKKILTEDEVRQTIRSLREAQLQRRRR